jgi:DNA-binding MurR/RpiR family transcriptional regulator
LSKANGLLTRLENDYDRLSPKLRLAARYVLDAPDDVAFASVRDTAARAGVHPSTLVRLAKTFGFPGYGEFRAVVQQRLRRPQASMTARAHRLSDRVARKPGPALFEDLMASGRRNLNDSFAATSAEQLERTADLLAQARRIYVIGMRKCFPVAYYIHYACRMFCDNVRLVTGNAGTFVDELRDVGAEDVLIAISYDPYTRQTVAAVEDAAARGATIVALTDSPVSPLARVAEEVFLIANASPGFFRSIAPAMALAESIVAALLARGGAESLDMLRGTEQQLQRFAAYWHEDGSRGAGA